ncbi:acid--CoA ligase [Halioglobus maricola]|uniref:Acid--CoA ligase n=1 Tax=Halioglobus maricola TaxID=2601894 RepID=A0A5P9NI48_9GAMM|nr:AMP-binding protein [Halioglobus maricola]QFU75471.1 acid--CoA ligase [Halioglobus maricola]
MSDMLAGQGAETAGDFSVDWLVYHATYTGDYLAAVDLDTGREFTYREFYNRITRVAGGLNRRFKINKGDRVAVLAHNSTDFFEILFACWEIGAIFVPLNWRLAGPELAHILGHCEPSLLIVDEEFEEKLEGISTPRIVRRSGAEESDYEALIRNSTPDFDKQAIKVEDVAMLIYTSGTTGNPKGVIHNFHMVRDTIIHAAQHGEVNIRTRSLSSAPLFHVAGLNGFAMPLFHYGGTIFMMRNWDPARAMAYLEDPELGITHMLGVPIQYQMLAEQPGFASAKFPSLRVAGVGAAPVPRSLLETWQAKGVGLSQSYGMTEAFSVAFLPAFMAEKKLGSAGFRVMHTQIQIGDENGEELPANQVGEVQIRGAAVTPGYWNDPDATYKAFINGWFRSGDAGRMDISGAVYIVDRYKDMFISGGENVYPAEVENALLSHPEVARAAVIGVEDTRWGQTGLAVICLAADSDLGEEAVRDYCRERLAGYKVPGHVRFADELPMSPQGKVLKQVLQERYAL